MNKYVLISAILTLTLPAHALELDNAVILEHRSWISGESNKSNMGFAITGNLKNRNIVINSATSMAKAHTSNVNGMVNQNIYTRGTHSYSVVNTSGSYQTYTVDIKLCANSTYCFHDRTRIGVNNNGRFSNNTNSYLTCMFTHEGRYPLEAITHVSGSSSFGDRSVATIYVKR